MAEEGHIDGIIRMAIARGRAAARRLSGSASLTAARAFGLFGTGAWWRRAYRADIVLIDALETCVVSDVVSAGRSGRTRRSSRRARPVPAIGLDSMKARAVSAADLAVTGNGQGRPVIGVVPGRIITEHLLLDLPVDDGAVVVDVGQDVAKVCVVERHGRNGNIGRGFVKGFGLKRGAIASSIGHDSHNICVVGTDDADMAAAVNHLGTIGGGFAVVERGTVLADLPLPVAGLMSDRSHEDVRAGLLPLRIAARTLGVTLAEPFLQVAFLPLPVIPHLKISDCGMVDVNRMALID